MEIACLVNVKMPATLKKTKFAEKYLELMKEKSTEPKNEETLGCFVTNIGTDVIQETVGKELRKSTVLPKIQPKKWIVEKCSRSTNALNRIKISLKLLKSTNFFRHLCCFLFCS